MSDSEGEDLDEMHFHFQRKQRRKSRRFRDGGEEPPIIRGLWVQEIDWLKSADGAATSSAEIIPPPPPFMDSFSQSCLYEGCSCAGVCECLLDSGHRGGSEDTASSDDRGDSDSDCGLEQDSECVSTQESESDSSCGAEDGQVPESFGAEARMSNLTFDPKHVSGFKSTSPAEPRSDSAGCVQSLLGISDSPSSTVNTSQNAVGFGDLSPSDTVLDFLRGRVTQMPKLPVSPFFRDLIKHTLSEWTTSSPHNDGLIFHHVRLRLGGIHYTSDLHAPPQLWSMFQAVKVAVVNFHTFTSAALTM